MTSSPAPQREIYRHLIRAAYAARQLAKRQARLAEQAADHLLPFIEYTKPDYKAGWFHREVCTVLERFLADVMAGKRPRLMLSAPPQHGKLLAHDTPIYTPDGWTKHGDLKPGATVFGRAGQPVKVLAVGKASKANREVVFSDGSVIGCHAAHEWPLYDRTSTLPGQVPPQRVVETRAIEAEGLWRDPEHEYPRWRVDPVAFRPAGDRVSIDSLVCRRTIHEIRSISPRPGRCIQVEGGVYLAGESLIPTHNSQLVSRHFPTWAQGKYPELRFLCASYGATWADSLSADRRKILLSSEYQDVFPRQRLTKLRSDYLQNADDGFMLAAGVGCGITGRSSDIGIIDDPIKGYEEAMSDSTREGIYNWYRTDFYSRLQKGAGVIIMLTRWHQDDLIGRLLEDAKHGSDAFHVINYPAIAEQDEEFRKIGEALAPERYDLRALEAIKHVQGTYAWNALYQGHPAPAEGLMLKRDYWRYYSPEERPQFDLIVLSIDCAFKSTVDSDHVAMHVWGFIGPRGYLLDRTCERMGYTATKMEAKRLAEKWHAHAALIEDTANGPAVIEEWRRTNHGEISILPIGPAGGKLARAWPFSADLEAGNAFLPEHEPFSGDIVDYASKFPSTSMDHDIDAMTQVFNWRRENLHGLLAYYEAEAKHLKEAKANANGNGHANGHAGIEPAPEIRICPACGSSAVRVLDVNTGERKCNQCGLQHGRSATERVEYAALDRNEVALETRQW
jgi:predicted phage terminase large subunit-like protein